MAVDQQTQMQLSLLLGPDNAHFETLIALLMSSSNEQRSHAEYLFSLCKQSQPDLLVLKLVHALNSSAHAELRAMSAVLLRKQLTRVDDDPEFIYPRLAESTRYTLKSVLLASLPQEGTKSIAKKLCDTISGLASAVLPENGWPELFPFILQCVTAADSPNLQEYALLIFSRLSQHIGETLIPHLPTLHSVISQSLRSSTSADVRIAALGASINLIQCLTSASDRDRFQDLLPLMMQTLTEALNSGQEATAQEALELLIELAGTEPRFLRRQLVEVVSSMLQIAEANSLEEGTRHLAIEFVITLTEARERAPGMMRKVPQLVRKLFEVLMNMLLDVEDDPAWHSAETEYEYAGESSNCEFGEDCLDRVAIALGGNTIVPVASEFFSSFLAAPEWQKHHAALIALTQIAEGCSKVLIRNMEQVVFMVLNSFQNPHPRVRWAAINAFGRLTTDLGPVLLNQYHQSVLPALAEAMDDFQNPRVQAQAAAVLDFSENCTRADLSSYLDGIVSKLLVLLQNEKQMVQESALTALGLVAKTSQDLFQKYYDDVMPYLKAILVNANDKAKRMLRAKSMECISLVGLAVGQTKFEDDAKQVMEVLMSLQGSQLEVDDPTTSYMLQAWARLRKCFGRNFEPYMSVVMPPLLQSAQLKPDVTFTSTNSDADINDGDDSIKIINLGDKRIGIKTSVLEEKATACDTLSFYAHEVKERFFPWIDQVAPILVPLLRFYFHEEVRKAAVSGMSGLLRSAKGAVKMGISEGRNESYVKQLSDYIIPALLEALHKEPEVEICTSMLNALNECVEVSGNLLDESQVKGIVDEIKLILTASSSRWMEREERARAEDFDADESEILKEENEQEEKVFDKVGDLLSTLLKTFKASFLPIFDELSSFTNPMLGTDRAAMKRRLAIYLFGYVAEHCGDAALRYYDTYVPILLEACNNENAGVREAALYGIGVCAEFGGSVFRPVVGEALSRLDVVITHPTAQHSDNVKAYDNAVLALGKICMFQRESIDAGRIVPAWLNCLPIKGNMNPAPLIHELFCSMLMSSDKDLLGPNHEHLPKIYAVSIELIEHRDDILTAARLMITLRKFEEELPPSVLASTWSSLDPWQQRIMRRDIISRPSF